MLWQRARHWMLSRVVLGVGILTVLLTGHVEAQRLSAGVGSTPPAPAKARAPEAFGTLPISFIENRGQVNGRVAYYVRGRDTTIYFTAEGVTLALTGPAAPPAASAAGAGGAIARPAGLPTRDLEGPRQRWAVKLDFVGANPQARWPVSDHCAALGGGHEDRVRACQAATFDSIWRAWISRCSA